ncbi:MAG: heme NO-binding domain-containing protein [Gemmatimonadales bacterium]|nr:heme NO-binding domain-containing protein [Gemmatimonadales bacterium]
MHGIVHVELQKYVIARHGRPVWLDLLKQAGIGNKAYLVSQQYPDTDIVALVTAASAMTKTTVPAVLEDFGEFIVPDLLDMYRPLLKPEWRTLELLEHTEGTIHSVVRLRNAGAAPPQLQCRRVGPSEVHLRYNSARKMCAVARGIVRGVARHFEESVTIVESACMHRGAPACKISVKRAAQSSSRLAS